MADRILIWHHEGTVRGDETQTGPAYYLEADYEAVAVRIHAEVAPTITAAEFDIHADGVSIFANRTPETISKSGLASYVVSTTSVFLDKNENTDDDADDFKPDIFLTEGSWVTCIPKKGGKGKNFTIALELVRVED